MLKTTHGDLTVGNAKEMFHWYVYVVMDRVWSIEENFENEMHNNNKKVVPIVVGLSCSDRKVFIIKS